MAEKSEVECKINEKSEPVKLKIFFNKISPRYPIETSEGKIETQQFLEASRSSIGIYDLLGTAFYVVKKDMLGNVEKLTKVFNKSPVKYKYLNDMILLEKDDPKIFAVDALLWLKRALEFMSCFLRNMILEWKSGVVSESVTHLVGAAYEKILKKHHNWFVQNIFKMVLRAFPTRKEIIHIFYYGNDGPETDVIKAAEKYLNELDGNLEVIVKMYKELGLEESSNEKEIIANLHD